MKEATITITDGGTLALEMKNCTRSPFLSYTDMGACSPKKRDKPGGKKILSEYVREMEM